ncbi:hypothetical protein A2V82_06980, partial [candidate division KSB1 bacterium RBG_16_48_16]
VLAQPVQQSGETVTVTDADIAPSAHVYWTADKTYLLSGRVFVDDGAVLNIEAGTVIKGLPGQGENASALIVARGGKIYAEGTPDRPIIFTSESDDLANPLVPAANEVGLWGGVILLGKARINAPGGETNIEGIPTTEPRGLYGGNDDDDCSGSLKYISIRHGGIEIGEGNEINGLTMGGVGRGTSISYIEVWSNKDDGYEWFGGTVNCDHLVSAFCKDDCFDIDEGYRGKLQFLFAIQSDSVGDHLGEHDGAPASFVGSEPFTHPIIYNATYLGAGENGQAGSRMLRLRENFGGEYINCIFGDYPGAGVTVEDLLEPDARDRLEAGDLVLRNNIWFNLSAGDDWSAIGSGQAWTTAHLSNAANGNTVEDPQLKSIGRSQDNSLDPRPTAAGPAYTNLAAYPNDDFFARVNYKGAFGSSNWAAGWTALSHYGILAQPTQPTGATVTVADADIPANADVYWTADKTYLLNGRVFVDDGATLNIEAGTVIKGMPGQGENASALIVARGGSIYAEGTGLNPIIFTGESDDLGNPLIPAANEVGLWGGLIVLGKARINAPGGETNIEGIPTTEPRGLYGGNDDNDGSGVIRYVSIRHGGIEIGEGNEINGLTLGGVGRGTIISNVEVWSNKDDGFEWFGGTVCCDHLIAAFCKDDAFDHDEGLRTKMQFLFAILADSVGDHCGEHDGAPASFVSSEPFAHPVIYNATYLGAGETGEAGSRILRLRENWGGEYKNCIFGDYPGAGVTVEDLLEPDARDRLESGDLLLQNNIWFNLAAGDDWSAIGSGQAWTTAYLSNAANGNTVEDPLLTSIRRDQTNGLDPRPQREGPAWNNLVSYPTAVVRRNSDSTVPSDFAMQQNYPNPFNPATTISYSLAKNAKVRLSVFNPLGQLVETLVDGYQSAGNYTAQWNALNRPTGVYFYRLEANDVASMRKMVL